MRQGGEGYANVMSHHAGKVPTDASMKSRVTSAMRAADWQELSEEGMGMCDYMVCWMSCMCLCVLGCVSS